MSRTRIFARYALLPVDTPWSSLLIQAPPRRPPHVWLASGRVCTATPRAALKARLDERLLRPGEVGGLNVRARLWVYDPRRE